MCLLVFAWKTRSDYPLILAGNRDEFHNRPAAAARWRSECEGVLAGMDLQAGGSWLGVNRDGRFAVVTNYREPAVDTSGRRSRGELVADFLATDEPVSGWLDGLGKRLTEYGGFNLIAGDRNQVHYETNRGEGRRDLAPGIYGLSNHRLDTPWPKVAAARGRLERVLENSRVTSDPLFQFLADRCRAADDELPDTGVPLEWERVLSAAFIVGPEYGTRASTVVIMGADGRVEFEERSFAPDGCGSGTSRFEFELD